MEFVALSDTVLNHLDRQDPDLNKAFRGVFPADKLSSVPYWRVFSDAYIVNTDPEGQPGEHWLAIWTRHQVCEVFDSYGLPYPLTRTHSYKLGSSDGKKLLPVIIPCKPWTVKPVDIKRSCF